jgi:dihydrofolate synthase/folylpolyglutamate synthase
VKSLAEWLAYIERQHPQAIALGLDRVHQVFEKMRLRLQCPVITVGGTNGKGSTCAMLEAMLRAGGRRTGLYTSPHLVRYNERVRISGREAGDALLCEGFEAVERARGETPLTYFEFGTLAAFWAFQDVEVAVLEVGLGGRLDAVNVLDADCAVLTSVGIDHVDWLGPDRESIGREKAGIFRAGRPARDRADRAAETARGLSALRVPAREGRDRHHHRPARDARETRRAARAPAGHACGIDELSGSVAHA